jgi:hypothetical protein
MQNLGTLRQLSLGDLADDGKRRRREREREEKIMPSLMATSLRWRTHSARTNCFEVSWGEMIDTANTNEFSNYLFVYSLLEYSMIIQIL